MLPIQHPPWTMAKWRRPLPPCPHCPCPCVPRTLLASGARVQMECRGGPTNNEHGFALLAFITHPVSQGQQP
eukprot:8239515-Lingulodinium_polyedra.AAC.1